MGARASRFGVPTLLRLEPHAIAGALHPAPRYLAARAFSPHSQGALLDREQSTLGAAPQSSDIATQELKLVHFNDVYNIEEREDEPRGGAARFVAKCLALQQEHRALTLFSGDAFNPSILSNVTRGEQMPPVLNACGVRAAVVGNHDLDFGRARLAELTTQCNFPWLLANVLDKHTGALFEGVQRYHIVDWHGVRCGLMGLVEREWLTTLATLGPDDVRYVDFLAEGRRLAALLRGRGCDAVIALTHMRAPNDELLAREVPDIDIVLGGHDHAYEVLRGGGEGGPLVFKSGTDFRELSLIRMQRRGDRFETQHERVEITAATPPHAETAALVRRYARLLGEHMDHDVGASAVALEGRFRAMRTRETNLGNLVADIIHHALDTDAAAPLHLAFFNSGSIRSDRVHEAGPLRMRDLVEMLPYCDNMAIVEMPGARLLQVLENAVSLWPRLEGRFLQVSNMSFAFDASRPAGGRVLQGSVKVQGKLLQHEALYRVGTKAYLLQGKDGYGSFADCRVIRDEEDCPQLPCLMSAHFEALRRLNERNAAGTLQADPADRPMTRLLQLAEAADDPEQSHIVRFCKEQRQFAVWPQVEGRVRCVNAQAEE